MQPQLLNIGGEDDMEHDFIAAITSPRARHSDPKTSHDAAGSVKGLRPKQLSVLKVFTTYGPLTHEQLIYRYNCERSERYLSLGLSKQSDSGIRTRVSELVKLGKVHDTGQRVTMSTGRKAIVWAATQ